MPNIVVRFQKARTNTGMSQADVAHKMGISLRTYQRIEANPEKLAIQDLKKYASLFVVTLRNILEDTNSSNQGSKLTNKEQELLSAYQTLSKELQDLYYHKIKGDALEQAIEEAKNAKASNTKTVDSDDEEHFEQFG